MQANAIIKIINIRDANVIVIGKKSIKRCKIRILLKKEIFGRICK